MLAAAWLVWQALWAHGGERELPWRDLTARTLGAPAHSQLAAFDEVAPLRAALGPSATVPPIDFERRRAVLIAAGPRSSSAYALDVLQVREERRRVVVTIRERTPTLAQPGKPQLAFPFRLLTLPRRDKPIELDWQERP